LVPCVTDGDNSCNWLGGQLVSHEIDATGFDCAGYTNITTSDNIVHGQVKQAGKFAFSRIYESGHEVPFYQPLVALEIFERAISGKDIATGKVTPGAKYLTEGTAESAYREGNSTIQFEILPTNSTYDTATNEPGKRDELRTVKRAAPGALSHVGKRFKP
jgi:carboxypeptidase D